MDLTKLLLLSSDFDRTRQKLNELICENKIISENQTETEAEEAMIKLSEAVERVEHEINILKESLKGSFSVNLLKDRLQSVFERKETESVISTDNDDNEQENNSLSLSLSLENVSTPNGKKNSTNNFEFEFVTTPTLEQLGLSGPTLSIVGAKRLGFESSASISDGEFDDSFYKKSPHSAGCEDNSFSSDVSVPNFRILNSSPFVNFNHYTKNHFDTTTKSSTLNNPNKSHNLKEVTSVASVLSGEEEEEEDSISIEKSDLEPTIKRVHFSEESENRILN